MNKEQKLENLIKQTIEHDRLANIYHEKSLKHVSLSLDLMSRITDLDIEINPDKWQKQSDGSMVKIF